MSLLSAYSAYDPPDLSAEEFELIRRLVLKETGISLSLQKKTLVINRLSKRLRVLSLSCFTDYYAMLIDPKQRHELQTAIDLLTTNETYFFREKKHFDFLKSHIGTLQPRPTQFRIWSAACSRGQEAYSIAMVLADAWGLATPWEILGTDISEKVLRHANQAMYNGEAENHIPNAYLNQFCLKGVRSQHGQLLINKTLRAKVSFQYINLHDSWPELGLFDFVFLRNVLIYFDLDYRKRLVHRVAQALKPSGFLLTGHAETLTGFTNPFISIKPSIYRLR